MEKVQMAYESKGAGPIQPTCKSNDSSDSSDIEDSSSSSSCCSSSNSDSSNTGSSYCQESFEDRTCRVKRSCSNNVTNNFLWKKSKKEDNRNLNRGDNRNNKMNKEEFCVKRTKLVEHSSTIVPFDKIPYCILLPNKAISHVIGKGGCSIREIEFMSGSSIMCQKEFEVKISPRPTEKMLTIFGAKDNKMKALHMIIEQVKEIIGLYDNNGNEAIIIIVPPKAIPIIIGQKGSKVTELSERSGCDITVHEEDVNGINDKAIYIKSKQMSNIIDCIGHIYDLLGEVVYKRILSMSDFPGMSKGSLWFHFNSNASGPGIQQITGSGSIQNIGKMEKPLMSLDPNSSKNQKFNKPWNQEELREHNQEYNTAGNNILPNREEQMIKDKYRNSSHNPPLIIENPGSFTNMHEEQVYMEKRHIHDHRRTELIEHATNHCEMPNNKNLLMHSVGNEESKCTLRFILDIETAAWVIGKSGGHIKDIRATAGINATIIERPGESEKVNSCDRILTLSGSPKGKYEALKLLVKPMEERDKNINNAMRMFVPGKAASFLIGKEGSVIRYMTEVSRAQIQVSKSYVNDKQEKLVQINGSPTSKLIACVLILQKLEEFENKFISAEGLEIPLGELYAMCKENSMNENIKEKRSCNSSTHLRTPITTHANTDGKIFNFPKDEDTTMSRTFTQRNNNTNVPIPMHTSQKSSNNIMNDKGGNMIGHRKYLGDTNGNTTADLSNNYEFNNGIITKKKERNESEQEYMNRFYKLFHSNSLPKVISATEPCTIELNVPNVYLEKFDEKNEHEKTLIEEISERSGCNISICMNSNESSSYTFNVSITGAPLSNSLAILMIQGKIFKLDWF